MKILLLLMSFSPLFCISQVVQLNNSVKSEGIIWAHDLSWQEVKNKAKKENKYIFLDCYTSWCAPCKRMDENVYTNQELGDFINNKFISVKVQMDKAKHDNEFVKSWYKDASAIAKQYRVLEYPSFIFLSPEGNIVHKETGYKDVNGFIEIAKTSLASKVYNNPYAEFDQLVADYNNGIMNYDRMPYMIKVARKLKEETLWKRLLKDHTTYILKVRPIKRYTKENIEMWASFIMGSHVPRFKFFYEDGNLIDKVMKQKGYAERVVDRTIWNEDVFPFFAKQTGGSVVNANKMAVYNPNKQLSYIEANWDELYMSIKKKYDIKCAERILVDAKLKWYENNKNWHSYVRYYLIKLNKYPYHFDFKERNITAVINQLGWRAFISTINKDTLLLASKWVAKALLSNPRDYNTMDTYAQLLYKAGLKRDALEWQQKVVLGYTALVAQRPSPEIKNDLKNASEALEKMQKSEPTYLHEYEPPIWEGIEWIRSGLE